MDKVRFTLGQIVFLKIQPEAPGMVTGIVFRPASVNYLVTWADHNENTHFEVELTAEKSYAGDTH